MRGRGGTNEACLFSVPAGQAALAQGASHTLSAERHANPCGLSERVSWAGPMLDTAAPGTLHAWASSNSFSVRFSEAVIIFFRVSLVPSLGYVAGRRTVHLSFASWQTAGCRDQPLPFVPTVRTWLAFLTANRHDGHRVLPVVPGCRTRLAATASF